MKIASSLAFVALLSSPALSPVPGSDLVVTSTKHSDAFKMMNQDQPAKDSTQVMWIGKDHLRIEDGDKVTIVRADLKKMYILDPTAKTFSSLDLPVDMKKYLPAEAAPMMEQMTSQVKATVAPTTETKKIKDWNATKYTLTMTLPMGATSTQEMWVTKDVAFDLTGWRDLYAAMMSANPMAASIGAEMKKIDGLPVLSERTQKMMGSEMKSSETVVSVEQKEPAAGLYDVPKDYTEKPFDPMADMKMGGPMAGRGPRPK